MLLQLVGRQEHFEAVGTATVLCEGVGIVDVDFELSEEGKGVVTLATLVRLPSHVSLKVERCIST